MKILINQKNNLGKGHIMKKIFVATLFLISISSCITESNKYRELTVKKVNIDRFMGKWYVIASIPTWLEKNAHNAIETYKKNKDGSIFVRFTFNKDKLNGEKKEITQTGYIIDNITNAYWKVRPIWPLLFDFLVIYLDEEKYETTMIGRPQKDYLWIMSRKSQINDNQYEDLLKKAKSFGYDISKITKLKHN